MGYWRVLCFRLVRQDPQNGQELREKARYSRGAIPNDNPSPPPVHCPAATMRLIFQLRFHTQHGQSLSLMGNHEAFRHGDAPIPLQYVTEEFWQATLEFPTGSVPARDITYHYKLHNSDGSIIADWPLDRRINPAAFE